MSARTAKFSKRALKLVFVRHGQTASNPLNILQGSHKPKTPLSPVGVQQAILLGRRLAGTKFLHVVTSDYARAVETTRLVLKESKFHSETEFSIDPRLRERNYGAADGRPLAEFFADCKEHGLEHFHFKPKGAEGYDEVMTRVNSLFQDLCKALDDAPWTNMPSEYDNSALLVSHGGFLLFLMKYFQVQAEQGKLELHSFKPEVAFEMCENTGMSLIEVHQSTRPHSSPRRIWFQSIYDTSHLSKP